MPNKKDDHRWRLMEARRAYGWSYFDFHAKQRTTMFNYYVLFTGFMFTGFATLLKEKEPSFGASLFLAFLGIISSIIFVFLDRRNEEFVHIAEDVLLAVEQDALFREEKRPTLCPRRRTILGIMEAESQEWQTGLFLRERADIKKYCRSPYRHSVWIPAFIWCMAGAYFVIIWYSISKML